MALVGPLVSVWAALWLLEWAPLVARMTGPQHFLAADFTLYMRAAARFFDTGTFYAPFQLTGAYGVTGSPILYPPELLALLAPFLVLPAFLWWAIPITTIVLVVARHRPRPLVWPLIAACLWWPETTLKILTGNPGLWTAAFVALGTVRPSLSALALLKPSLFPFALIGIRSRWWWVAAAIAVLPFCWLLPDYVAALSNFRSPDGLFYSLSEAPLPAIPVIAWLGGCRFRLPSTIQMMPSRRSMVGATAGR